MYSRHPMWSKRSDAGRRATSLVKTMAHGRPGRVRCSCPPLGRHHWTRDARRLWSGRSDDETEDRRVRPIAVGESHGRSIARAPRPRRNGASASDREFEIGIRFGEKQTADKKWTSSTPQQQRKIRRWPVLDSIGNARCICTVETNKIREKKT